MNSFSKGQENSFLAVEIEINNFCNGSCSYCPNSKYPTNTKKEMEVTLFKLILKQLKDLGYQGRLSYHFYNEPLLSSNLDCFISLSKKYLPDCRVVIFTNGTLLTKFRLKKLVDLGVDKFTVTKHKHFINYRFEHLYSDLEHKIRKKIKYQTHLDLSYTNRGGTMPQVGNQKVRLPLTMPCFIPSCSVLITVTGDVLPCFEDFHRKNIMGNVTQNHIVDIWNTKKYKNFRKALKKGERGKFSTCDKCNSVLVIPT